MTQSPLFLMSLPRSGSTLVQRVLAAHEEVSTAPEPWILLPQLYSMRETGAYTDYGQVPSSRAIREFAERLPGGRAAYEEELRNFALGLYRRASGGKGRYFLDKTPRYHFIAEDLHGLFPDARFIYLWRNPLAIVASISETWGGGRWTVDRWHTDLFDGLVNLTAAFEAHADTVISVRYEDLVSDPANAWPPLFDYLGLEFEPGLLTSFTRVEQEARMGDPTGTRDYQGLSTQPLEKWRRTLAGPVRRRWCRRYLEALGESRLALMGYDLGELLRSLDETAHGRGHVASDLARTTYARADRAGRRAAARLLWRKRSV